MEQGADIRWIQRYANFHKACGRLLQVTEADRFMDDLSELELEGLVQRFEYTFELSWKVMQDLLIYKGYEFMLGPNGTMKMAFEDGLITDHDGWRKMARSRNTLSYIYDEEVLPIIKLIYSDYAPLLKKLDEQLALCSHTRIPMPKGHRRPSCQSPWQHQPTHESPRHPSQSRRRACEGWRGDSCVGWCCQGD